MRIGLRALFWQNRLAVVVDDVLRVEGLNAKERRLLVLRKPAQNDDVDRVDGGADEGCMHGDGGLDDGRVVGAERRDDALSRSAQSSSDTFFRRGGKARSGNKNRAC